MIVSHKHRFIYIAIPKTATHSVRQVFRPHLGQYDWEQCQLIEEKLFPFPQIAQLKHGHLTLDELNRVFRKEFWGDYFSFCFVRNPYDRFLSYCYFINRFNEKMKKDPEKTIYAILDDPEKMRQNLMLKPQHHFTHNGIGNQIVDSEMSPIQRIKVEQLR